MKREAKNRARGILCGLLPLPAMLFWFAPATLAEENVRLACATRTFHVVPGEPMRLELTVQADSAAPLVHLHVPADPLLLLRAVEKLSVQRTKEGAIVHKRVIIWQALEPGTVTISTLSIEFEKRKFTFPPITITVSDPGT